MDTILLGVTGSIAAYRAADMVRRFQEAGYNVNCVMTAGAKEFITPLTLRTLSGNPVYDDLFFEAKHHSSPVTHIGLAQNCAAVVIAPASADVIGKLASGIADDLLTTVVMAASDKKVFIAPAMNTGMWKNKIVRENVKKLEKLGYIFIGPKKGKLACGDKGEGHIEDTEKIVSVTAAVLKKKSLKGKTVLITSGPTREFIDDVRFISNPSSGKTGYYLAMEAKQRGASVIFITGKTSYMPAADKTVEVVSASEMMKAVKDNIKEADIVIGAAAVGDYSVQRRKGKMKRSEGVELKLTPTEDIIAWAAANKGKKFIAGFSAESEGGEKRAVEKMIRKKLDMTVFNDISKEGRGFESDDNQISIFAGKGRKVFTGSGTKQELASEIIDNIIKAGG
ncbi:MAG TPA: bifunctional phosphopantothenoylcysteine decarboxylase/phosphopantothenate--cysteine ligase CoaBC [Candidatus Goldiibacteriota bacterium]|nr:bifunctional phosphopantothenoylcysteine decarboxylase/phosphopantothenate--cysteine ligase CoaBC [Candidatus Goldiibacteriota bacterium]HRQ43312.1 bifunctional phosphopantothenoylcysteine decarboxylase/phosphopantothenate--cysteine ligase CoaBC [Candidatus Goldiibacteriota bacterium]